MLPIAIGDETSPLKILAIGAHCDDIEIGAGGTLSELSATRPTQVDLVVMTSTEERACEARASADGLLGASLRSLTIHPFRDGFLPYEGPSVKEAFEELKSLPRPDLIVTHMRDDRHQDHRLVNELTWNTFRNDLILEYEIPKYDADLGSPNVFVPLSREAVDRKWELLNRHFSSQRDRSWFTQDTFSGLARIRGIECASPSGLAEAFTSRKTVIQLGGYPSASCR